MAWVAIVRWSKSKWWVTAMPAGLDADGNSIPCEAVCPTAAVSNFWYQ
jgi:hypothetical protein